MTDLGLNITWKNFLNTNETDNARGRKARKVEKPPLKTAVPISRSVTRIRSAITIIRRTQSVITGRRF